MSVHHGATMGPTLRRFGAGFPPEGHTTGMVSVFRFASLGLIIIGGQRTKAAYSSFSTCRRWVDSPRTDHAMLHAGVKEIDGSRFPGLHGGSFWLQPRPGCADRVVARRE